MALAMAMISCGPILAPLAGTGLVALGGWRMTFAAMMGFGVIMSFVALVKLDETNRNLRPDALDWGQLKEATLRVLSHPQSRFFLILAALLAYTIISFIAHAPRFYKTAFGLEGLDFAIAFGLMGSGIIFGQFINSFAIGRFGVVATTKGALAFLALVCAAMALTALSGKLSATAFGTLMFLFNCAFLSLMANSASLTLDPHPKIAGLASSVFGFVTQLVPGTLTLATLPLISGDVGRWAVMSCVLTLALLAALLRYGAPARLRPASP
jgi:MFS transporter, DHA1 family, multidrug resistance protein